MAVDKQSQRAAGAVTKEQEAADLLDQVIAATRPQDDSEAERAKTIFQQFLDRWSSRVRWSPRTSRPTSSYWIGEIDKKLSAQLNEILHHPEFQKLEGTWRGLHYLVHQTETGENLKIRVLNVSKKRAVQGPGKGRRVRPERAVQEDLRGRIRPARRPALRHAGRRLRVRPQRRGHRPAQDDLQRRRRRPRPVRRRRQPQDVQLRPLRRAVPSRATWPRSSRASSTPPGSRSANRKTRATSP